MSHCEITVGIDHGTTNSCIAVMEDDGPRVIKPTPTNLVMPSAVYLDRDGRQFIGQSAYNAIMQNSQDEGDGYIGYKLEIGQNPLYRFKAANKTLTAQELGGLVISELINLYQEVKHREARACVITVPAIFEESAVEGTRVAAEKAGLKHIVFVNEPIAAALAYGFSEGHKRAVWMIYDLGGGTFDLSLITVRSGRLIVMDHAGQERLGGRDFDRELMDYVLGPKKSEKDKWERYKNLDRDYAPLRSRYALEEFVKKNPKYNNAWRRLMLAIEKAKIELSRKKEAVVFIEGDLCEDENGKPVEVEIPITREIYEKLISTYIRKTIHVCDTLLEKNRLGRNDLDKLIFIGGPTKTPYVQDVVRNWLGRESSSSIDPMTAVAQGAAIFASTIDVPEDIKKVICPEPPGSPDQVKVHLIYEKNSKISEPMLKGTIEGFDGDMEDLSVEVKRSDDLWSSGRISVRKDGGFSLTLRLAGDGRKPHLSGFTTTVFDKGKQVAQEEGPRIWYPYQEGQFRLSHSFRIGLVQNATAVLLDHGAALPAKNSSRDFFTARDLKKGSNDTIKIPVLEGVSNNLFNEEDPHADCCIHIGSIFIDAGDILRDLPKGSEVEVTLEIDRYRNIQASAYIPLLDQDFFADFKGEAYGPEAELDAVIRNFEETKRLYRECEELQRKRHVQEVAACLDKLRELKPFEEIEKQISRAREGEEDAARRAYKQVLALKGDINKLRELQGPVRIEQKIEELEKVTGDFERRQLDETRTLYRETKEKNDPAAYIEVEKLLDEIDIQVRHRPYYDVQIDGLAILDAAEKKGLKVNNYQVEVFKKGGNLLKVIDEKGGINSLTESDIDELKKMHDEFVKAYPNLYGLREDFLKGIQGVPSPEKVGLSDIISRLRQ